MSDHNVNCVIHNGVLRILELNNVVIAEYFASQKLIEKTHLLFLVFFLILETLLQHGKSCWDFVESCAVLI